MIGLISACHSPHAKMINNLVHFVSSNFYFLELAKRANPKLQHKKIDSDKFVMTIVKFNNHDSYFMLKLQYFFQEH